MKIAFYLVDIAPVVLGGNLRCDEEAAYPNNGWVCDNPGGGRWPPFKLSTSGDIQCHSEDHHECNWTDSLAECQSTIANMEGKLPLECGDMHTEEFGGPGYEYPWHQCSLEKLKFTPEPTTVTPEPTPEPTTATPEPTTATPEPTTAMPKPTPEPTTKCTVAQNNNATFEGYTKVAGRDIGGYDFECKQNNTCPDQCKQACDSNPRCKSFNYVRPVLNTNFDNMGSHFGCCYKSIAYLASLSNVNPNIDFFAKILTP